MMKMSTRGRYALRAMLDLSLHSNGEPVPRHEIAERQEISAAYAAQLFRQLNMAELVTGVKGPGGGYLLAREPEQITTGDVIRAVEGPLAAVDCVRPDCEPACPRMAQCAAHWLWQGLSKTIAEFLDSVTLQDLQDHALQLAMDAASGSQDPAP
jgi:Rrf2 family protein